MANYRFLLFLDISFVLMIGMSLSSVAANDDRKAYIVYMGMLPEGEYLPTSNHQSIPQRIIKESSVADTWIRSYKRSFNGFVAKLTDEEAEKLASMKEVVSVFPNRILHLHTTRSWDFMGFNNTVIHNSTTESNVIIGVIDSGIWPKSPSSSDEGFGPPPKKWKGACIGGKNFTCNNKLIAARFYQTPPSSQGSARDDAGHGSHTSSTAAGNKVKDISFFGLAQGTAKGGVPSARIAAYKACNANSNCMSADVLAAFDDAIADGVDILTVSLGGNPVDFFNDVIAIGSLHAMEKGILTVNSAGNDGDNGALGVSSVAPWMLAVAASTTDRKFIDKVVLGNGKTVTGLSINPFASNGTKLPIVYDRDFSRNCSEISAGICLDSCIDRHLVKGKITLCDNFLGNIDSYNAGAAGSIVRNDQYVNFSHVLALPATALNDRDHFLVKSYWNSTKNPVAEILRSETILDLYSPVVAQFSSLGPNFIVPDIMKPDITAPGVEILAAYSPMASLTDAIRDKRRVQYSIMSGTSMACPHAAGVAAYVKTYHPDWSPSAIQSALMTTAWPMDKSKNPNGEISYGSGHINPVKAVHPGLVYEAFKEDYIKLMCSLGYSLDHIKQVSGRNNSCPKTSKNVLPRDLNYPSLTVSVPANKSFTVTFHRTVKNVGFANSTYKVEVSPDSKLKVEVVPAILSFRALNEKKSFTVTANGEGFKKDSFLSSTLIWSDGNYTVRSPVVVHTYSSITRSNIN